VETTHAQPHPSPVPRTSLAGCRVFLVEDDAQLAERLAEGLEEEGAKVVRKARSQIEALNGVRMPHPDYDLMILDVGLPANQKAYEAMCALTVEINDLTREILGTQPNLSKESLRTKRGRLVSKRNDLVQPYAGRDVAEELARVLKSTGRKPAPVVFLTCIADEAIAAQCMAFLPGHSVWVTKPISMAALCERLSALLGTGMEAAG
jgi:CheY-like chemotaxis protein